MERTRRWARIGRLAAIALSQPASGQRLVRETQLAGALGLSRATLRHYRDAVQNVRTLPDWNLRRRLYRESAVAANTMARWFHRDSRGAYEYLYRGWRSDAELIAAARAARSQAFSPRRSDLDQPLQGWLEALLPGRPWRDAFEHIFFATDYHPVLAAPRNETARFLGVDFEIRLRLAEGVPGTPVMAVVEVPRLVLLDRYRQEARPLWTRAVAMSLLYERVVVVFPGPASRRRFLAALPRSAAQEWSGHPEDRAALSGVRPSGVSSPIICRPGPAAGIILLSTRIGLKRDLFKW